MIQSSKRHAKFFLCLFISIILFKTTTLDFSQCVSGLPFSPHLYCRDIPLRGSPSSLKCFKQSVLVCVCLFDYPTLIFSVFKIVVFRPKQQHVIILRLCSFLPNPIRNINNKTRHDKLREHYSEINAKFRDGRQQQQYMVWYSISVDIISFSVFMVGFCNISLSQFHFRFLIYEFWIHKNICLSFYLALRHPSSFPGRHDGVYVVGW